MARKLLFILLFILLLNTPCGVAAKRVSSRKEETKIEIGKVGKTLPAWSKGCLDIHFINSGRGECCFYILPDGTTLLVDAGEVAASDISTMQRPNDDVRPYQVYAKYIRKFMPAGQKAIDYCVASHLHIDHIGSIACATETSSAGYRKSGLLALFDEVPYKRVLDSAYPTYDSYDISGQLAKDWTTFVRWGDSKRVFKAERFQPGEEQIKLLNKPNRYKDFSIFNICANGRVWGMDKSGNTRLLGKTATSLGNSASCGFHIRYGSFDYIACGDLVSAPQNRVAYYFRDFIGAGNLDSFKCHHHMAGNSWGSQMVKCNFNPRIILNHCFAANKPHPEKLAYALDRSEGYFATNIHPAIFEMPLVKEKQLIDRITAYGGHIVLRVMPGGKKFYVYMLDDGDFEYRVKSVHGPYKSK